MCASAARACTATAHASTAVKLRYRSKPLPARISDSPAAGRHRELMLELDEPVAGAAPGQLACLMDGELISRLGHDHRARSHSLFGRDQSTQARRIHSTARWR